MNVDLPSTTSSRHRAGTTRCHKPELPCRPNRRFTVPASGQQRDDDRPRTGPSTTRRGGDGSAYGSCAAIRCAMYAAGLRSTYITTNPENNSPNWRWSRTTAGHSASRATVGSPGRRAGNAMRTPRGEGGSFFMGPFGSKRRAAARARPRNWNWGYPCRPAA